MIAALATSACLAAASSAATSCLAAQQLGYRVGPSPIRSPTARRPASPTSTSSLPTTTSPRSFALPPNARAAVTTESRTSPPTPCAGLAAHRLVRSRPAAGVRQNRLGKRFLVEHGFPLAPSSPPSPAPPTPKPRATNSSPASFKVIRHGYDGKGQGARRHPRRSADRLRRAGRRGPRVLEAPAAARGRGFGGARAAPTARQAHTPSENERPPRHP